VGRETWTAKPRAVPCAHDPGRAGGGPRRGGLRVPRRAAGAAARRIRRFGDVPGRAARAGAGACRTAPLDLARRRRTGGPQRTGVAHRRRGDLELAPGDHAGRHGVAGHPAASAPGPGPVARIRGGGAARPGRRLAAAAPRRGGVGPLRRPAAPRAGADGPALRRGGDPLERAAGPGGLRTGGQRRRRPRGLPARGGGGLVPRRRAAPAGLGRRGGGRGQAHPLPGRRTAAADERPAGPARQGGARAAGPHPLRRHLRRPAGCALRPAG